MAETRRYRVPLDTFGRNITNEAIRNKDSFVYHEAEGYESGLLGYHKPLTQAMFGNYDIVEAAGTLLEPDLDAGWDESQWRAYCRIVLITLRNYADHSLGNHSVVLARAVGHMETAARDLYKIDGTDRLDADAPRRLSAVVDFVSDALQTLKDKPVPTSVHRRLHARGNRGIYDFIAALVFELVYEASSVRSPIDLCWSVQYGDVWSPLFTYDDGADDASDLVRFKVRRLLYDDIAEMETFPNFKGAHILGFCLNVMGLAENDTTRQRTNRALHHAALRWTKKNYAWLHAYVPRVAEACLVAGMAYEAAEHRIVKTYPAEGLRHEPRHIYLNVDPLDPNRLPPPAYG